MGVAPHPTQSPRGLGLVPTFLGDAAFVVLRFALGVAGGFLLGVVELLGLPLRGAGAWKGKLSTKILLLGRVIPADALDEVADGGMIEHRIVDGERAEPAKHHALRDGRAQTSEGGDVVE